jgi:tetratricopeptide (TPR) repeat protein
LARLAGPIGPVLKALEQMVQAATDGKPGKLVRGGEPLTEKGERYALDMVQSYTKEYFDKGTPEDLAKGREVAELTIRLFPRSPEGYNSLGGFYASRGDWKKSLPLFLKAHAIDPKDDLVTNNVSYCYLQLGSEAKARPFIEQVAQHGTDADMVAVAKRRLAGLKK